jgi:hypothetical protein
LAALVASPLLVSGCASDAGQGESNEASASESAGTTDTGDGGEELRPNWHQDIAPLVALHCESCHQSGGIAPFSMEDYESTAQWSTLMSAHVQAETMPPWHARDTADCTTPQAFLGDPRLDDETKQLFADWSAAGAPEGNPANAAEVPAPPSLHLEDPTQVVDMSGSVSIEAEGNKLDFVHCLSFDPELSEDVYVDAMEVLPGNDAIAHHVLIYIDEAAESASWDGGVLENCDGGSGVSGGKLIGGWVPGSLPQTYPDGVAVPIPAGSRLVFNYHYHATGGSPEIDDSSQLALRYSSEEPDWIADFSLIGNYPLEVVDGIGAEDPPFWIPANEENHVETMRFTMPPIPEIVDLRLFTIANHAHVIATDILTTIEPANGDPQWCALQTPGWDFDWQRIYRYDVDVADAPRVRSGDIIRVRCTYNNSLSNPALPPALAEQGLTEPVEVFLGEETLDEMCLAAFGTARKNF